MDASYVCLGTWYEKSRVSRHCKTHGTARRKLELTNKEGKDALFYARDEAFEAELRALADANKK